MGDTMHEALPAHTTGSDTHQTLRQRVQAWLARRGARALILISFTMILLTLGETVATHVPTADWRVYATVLILLVLLGLRIAWDGLLTRALGDMRANEVVIFSSGVLVLLALWLDRSNTLLIGNLLPVLSAEAAITLRVRTTSILIVGLFVSWFLLRASYGVPQEQLASETFALVLGMAIAAAFAGAVRFYLEQAEHMQRLNVQLLAAHERERELAVAEERVRLARDIHDGLGHHLTVLSVQLQAAERLLDRDPARVAETLALCRAETQAALADVRQSVAALRQSPLDGRSLAAALEKLTSDFAQAAALQTSFGQQGQAVPLPAAAAMTVYRAAQEGLTNVQKHAAHATRVTVTLTYTAGDVRLTVQDDGTTAALPHDGSGFGLAGLHERADQLGGTLRAVPQSPQGFVLELRLPLPASASMGAGA
jgi:signal transduction histidine kinase